MAGRVVNYGDLKGNRVFKKTLQTGMKRCASRQGSSEAGGADVSRRTRGLKSGPVAAQPGKWVQQALVAGHAHMIIAAADQIRGGLEALVAERAFFALHLGPACISLFADDAFTFHGPAFHASVSSGRRPLYTNPMPPARMPLEFII
jgi:hypothetical protein